MGDGPASPDVANLHRRLYEQLSSQDWELHNAGISAERRHNFWTAVEHDEYDTEGIEDQAGLQALRSVQEVVATCRKIRERARQGYGAWCASSIYELLLVLFTSHIVESDAVVYRGHLDTRWELVPSFFRLRPRISPLLYPRTVYGGYRYAERVVGEPLNLPPVQAEAAAQHYGTATTLLDVTESLRVAAYFATTPLRPTERRGPIGSIYALSTKDLERVQRAVIRGRDMTPKLSRIHATKGAFLSAWGYSADEASAPPVTSAGDFVRWFNRSGKVRTTLDEMGYGIEQAVASPQLSESAVYPFYQTADEFEDRRWGVTRDSLGFTKGVKPLG